MAELNCIAFSAFCLLNGGGVNAAPEGASGLFMYHRASSVDGWLLCTGCHAVTKVVSSSGRVSSLLADDVQFDYYDCGDDANVGWSEIISQHSSLFVFIYFDILFDGIN